MRPERTVRTLLLVALALTAALLLAACGSSSSGGGTSGDGGGAGDGGTPQRGGKVVMLDTGEGESLDPAVIGGILSARGSYPIAVFDTLVYEQAGSGEIVPEIAKSLSSSDGVRWTLELRPDVRFSDGTSLDAEAVRFNWERIATAKVPSPSTPAAQSIKSLKVVDPLHLSIVLKARNGQFPRVVAEQLPFIGSPTAIEKLGDAFGRTPVGAGPFLLKRWVPGSEAHFVRNPDYWNAPRPYVDELVMRAIPDDEQRYNTMASGGGTLMNIQSGYRLVERGKTAGFDVESVPGSGGFAIPLNMRAAPFDDLTARRALAAAIDRQGLVDTVMGGQVKPFTTMFNEQSPFYDAAVRWPQFDATEAQGLIDDYASRHGGPLTFRFLFASGFEPYGEYLQTQLSQFENLKVSVEFLAPTAFFQRLVTGNFQASISVPAYADPEPVVYDTFATGGSRNFGHYSSPTMDRALADGRAGLDADSRKPAYAQVQQLAIDDAPLVWLTQYAFQQLTRPDLKGLDWAGAGVVLWDRLWLDK
jgi:peptide/nickel transport system substrate-binding protein